MLVYPPFWEKVFFFVCILTVSLRTSFHILKLILLWSAPITKFWINLVQTENYFHN